MKKDKMTGVRMNGKVKEIMNKMGKTAQKIVDEWISKNIDIQEKVTVKAKKK